VKIATIFLILVAALLGAGCTSAPKVSTPERSALEAGFRLQRVVPAVRQRYGDDGVAQAKNWHDALSVFQKEAEQSKLKDVNDYVNNRIRLDTDLNIWGQNDYWATPIEAFLKGAGDCEDYALAKYFSLKFSGVPVSKLRMVYVKAKIGGADSKVTKPHMVVTHYATPDAEPLVLDSLINEIRPASRRTDLIPIFSFNSEGVWAADGNKSQPGDASHLSKWGDLLDKMKKEGFE